MLDEYLERADVILLMNRIGIVEKYYAKEVDDSLMTLATPKDIALFNFYDALYKFKVVIDDINLFDNFIVDLEKLYKKIDNFQDISLGINKLICKLVAEKLNIKYIDDDLSKKEIISYVFNRYIVDGYYIYGFNNLYSNDVKSHGFVPERCNTFQNMIEINKIFAKYGINDFFDNDFSKNDIYYTDSFLMGCYYSLYYPTFFYNSLVNSPFFDSNIVEDISLKESYSSLKKSLKRFINSTNISDKEEDFIIKSIDNYWNGLHNNKNMSLLLVKRRLIKSTKSRMDEFINNDQDVYENIDRILNSKYINISFNKDLYNNFEVIDLKYFKEFNPVLIDDNTKKETFIDKFEVDNAYGKVSILIIVGSLLISLGVIATIILILRGGIL